MANFFGSNLFYLIVSVLLIVIGIYQLVTSVVYIKGVLHQGTDNGFMPIAMWTSLLIGVFLVIAGMIGIWLHAF
ncbi:hypothetical protein EQ500_07955 [Lactobacillus sp. XV13L]|nr:hypothetical protein [Lactobacillus sp. XV13L]